MAAATWRLTETSRVVPGEIVSVFGEMDTVAGEPAAASAETVKCTEELPKLVRRTFRVLL